MLVNSVRMDNIYVYYPTVLVKIISHDIVQSVIVQLVVVQYHTRAPPVTLVVFFQVTEKGWKRLSLIINLLLNVSV